MFKEGTSVQQQQEHDTKLLYEKICEERSKAYFKQVATTLKTKAIHEKVDKVDKQQHLPWIAKEVVEEEEYDDSDLFI